MESINNDKIQKTLVTPGIGGQPTFSSGTKVSQNKKEICLLVLFRVYHGVIIFINVGIVSFYYTNCWQ